MKVFTTKDHPDLKAGEWTELDVSDQRNSRTVFTERFAEAVFEGRLPDIPGEEARRTLEAIVAAYRSGTTHQPVTLPLEA